MWVHCFVFGTYSIDFYENHLSIQYKKYNKKYRLFKPRLFWRGAEVYAHEKKIQKILKTYI